MRFLSAMYGRLTVHFKCDRCLELGFRFSSLCSVLRMLYAARAYFVCQFCFLKIVLLPFVDGKIVVCFFVCVFC